MAVTDGKTALDEVKQSFGVVPEFLRRYPQEGLAGAWTEMRDVEMNPSSAIPGKYKSLIGLAVAAQIPCKFCIVADTEFAKLEGATERELTEAVAMAGLIAPLEHDRQRPPGRQGGVQEGHQPPGRGAKKHMAAAPHAQPPADDGERVALIARRRHERGLGPRASGFGPPEAHDFSRCFPEVRGPRPEAEALTAFRAPPALRRAACAATCRRG